MTIKEDSPGVAELKRDLLMHQASFNLFSTQKEIQEDEGGAGKLLMLNPNDLVDFRNHVFNEISSDDPRYTSLTNSIKNLGIVEPLIIFRNERNEYEIISGHCRKRIASDLNLDKVPVLLKNIDRNEATIMMITTNLERRENILPSEKAKSYQLLLDTIENQNGKKLGEGRYDRWEKLSEKLGKSKATVSRYIVLNSLIDELLDLVDIGRIHLGPATVIATLNEKTQKYIYKYFVESGGVSDKGVTPSHDQAIDIKMLEKGLDDLLDYEQVCDILAIPKPNQKPEFKIPPIMYDKYLSDCNKQSDVEREIIKAFEFYNKYKDLILNKK